MTRFTLARLLVKHKLSLPAVAAEWGVPVETVAAAMMEHDLPDGKAARTVLAACAPPLANVPSLPAAVARPAKGRTNRAITEEERIVAIIRAHPTWTAKQVAAELEWSTAYLGNRLGRIGITWARLHAEVMEVDADERC